MKQATLLDSLARISSVVPGRAAGPGPRRRSGVTAARRAWPFRHVERKGRVLVGFREAEKPWVVDMLSCATAEPAISRLIEPLVRADRQALGPRPPAPGGGHRSQTTRRPSCSACSIRPRRADRDALAGLCCQPGRAHLPAAWQSGVRRRRWMPEAAWDDLHYRLPAFNLTLTFGPTDFIQVHGEVNRLMVDQALGLLAPAPTDRVLDLYCGIGNFTLPLARRAGEVTGLEGCGGCRAPGPARNATLASGWATPASSRLTWRGRAWRGRGPASASTWCCSTRRGPVPPSCSRRWAGSPRAASSTCPAIPGRWPGMPASWSASTGTGLPARESWTCSRTPATWSPWRCSSVP